ncbi:hypothetical protein GGTG_01484 [Gaeumannomyces tritici R3-111a-1]|uniref:Protein kinase domain-containing protein n=1 Tax=Gaeumannomyces tritici (strain R3-111a-1) TaxID=644352 RepID=J3NJQ4_GAET3|nr:hypothetical protein GGTG_01484 [Gaeumannomyces tritici R3-111a-1]EJT81506.1 hypothetical protein GGTG_01484 [Gaeumannomyces tritici R3-111a-1]
MDLDSLAIHAIVHPTAAFSQDAVLEGSGATPAGLGDQTDHASDWAGSQLNPKNRIDSLDFPSPPLWRIDGSAGLGTQYYAVPLFLGSLPPLRIDVFVAEYLGKSSPILRSLLDLDKAFHTKDAARVNRLGIARHIVRALHLWASNLIEAGNKEVLDNLFRKAPFGTKIIFQNLELDVANINISIDPNHELELRMLSVSDLSSMWDIPAEEFPPSISLDDLEFVTQLHDSVCVVRQIAGPGSDGGRHDDHDGLLILKALSSSNKYLYHELRVLLTIPAHPNIVERPLHLITKQVKFGNKKGIVGFTLFYHRTSSIRDHVPYMRIHGQLKLPDQVKWATQLTSALIHIRGEAKTYYPDLRLDNVVLSEAGDAVMVDFEQRGVWCEFGSPEANNIEFLRILACDDPSEFTGYDAEPTIGEELRSGYAELLKRLVPNWEDLYYNREYDNPSQGYNLAWKALTPPQQEAAEVYMLGRVLWCLFEGMAAPKRGAVWQSYRREPEIEFPEYSRTPSAMRRLIDRCTAGRRPAWSDMVARVRSRVVLKSGEVVSQRELRQLAKTWWTSELQENGLYLDKQGRGADLDKLKQTDASAQRPPLREVLKELEAFKASIPHS